VTFSDVASGGGVSQNAAQSNLTALPATWTPGANWDNSPAALYGSN
jgi:hypothetical protein